MRKRVLATENVCRAQDGFFDYVSLKSGPQTLLWVMLALTIFCIKSHCDAPKFSSSEAGLVSAWCLPWVCLVPESALGPSLGHHASSRCESPCRLHTFTCGTCM